MRILDRLNSEYAKLHTKYEELFWKVNMGEIEKSGVMDKAQKKRDEFRANKNLLKEVESSLKIAKGESKKRLAYWKNFFLLNQVPEDAQKIKDEINKLENEIARIRQSRKEGYTDPKTNEFISASENKMRGIIRTNSDENIRRACFLAVNELPHTTLDLYLDVIKKRNEFANILGFENFYEYKLKNDENMKLGELLPIFDRIYEKTKTVFDYIRSLEKEKPGINLPWNFSYMIAGDFTKEEDPYFQIEDALIRFGQSFSALKADLGGGKMMIDLLDRKGKHNNGFCHWPRTVSYIGNNRIPGEARISCNAVLGEIGEGYSDGHMTLFHEGGHAVHYLNSTQKDVILNHEYPPSSVSWAETQSMFMDSILESIEWKTRYAKNKNGQNYPFELYEKKLRRNYKLKPLSILSIAGVVNYESQIYREKNLNKEKIIEIAENTYKKYWGLDYPALNILNVPHIYSWESSAYYHGYGLAEIQVEQWRNYFYKKYGYIVDNPNIGKEMKKVWKLGASLSSKEFIKIATGKKINPEPYIKSVMIDPEKEIAESKKKISKLEKIKRYTKQINLNGEVYLVHGKEKISDSKRGFEEMAKKYSIWLNEKLGKK